MISKLQYISQGRNPLEHLKNIQLVLEAGCRWVQLRLKDISSDELRAAALQTRQLCDKTGAVFILNDDPLVAYECRADGVHLGLGDMAVSDARKIIGENRIIGGTANTLEQVLRRASENCSYVGVGPFRFTKTKKELSPVLGAEGFRKICDHLLELKINIPLVAIGGILADDVPRLLESGVYGVAVSGALSNSASPLENIRQFNSHLYANI